MIRRPPRSTQSRSSAASDVYKRQVRASVEIMTLAIEAGIPSNADPREGIDLERMLQWDLASHYQP